MKPRILFLFHLPPPVHGSSVMGLALKNSSVIKEKFNTKFINLLASNSVSDSGKLSITKVIILLSILFKVLTNLIFFRPKICYLALTATGFAFYRDVLLVLLVRLFNVKRIYHLHNKGISKQNGKLNSYLYRIVFKNAKVIILSKHLFSDIEQYVEENNTYICPNGIPKFDIN